MTDVALSDNFWGAIFILDLLVENRSSHRGPSGVSLVEQRVQEGQESVADFQHLLHVGRKAAVEGRRVLRLEERPQRVRSHSCLAVMRQISAFVAAKRYNDISLLSPYFKLKIIRGQTFRSWQDLSQRQNQFIYLFIYLFSFSTQSMPKKISH